MEELEYRKVDISDLEFILKLKELCLKWYIEVIYGWDIDVQREKTKHEIEKLKDHMRIIIKDGIDKGITTFYKDLESDEYVVGLTMIDPSCQGLGIGTKIISEYIDIARKDNKRIRIKTYELNPAKRLYERLGFKEYDHKDYHSYLDIDFTK